jgi:ABC-type bacteriocin/lantibiotic exporter with double-glycine peptidase domain
MNKIGINKWKIFQIINAAFVGIVLLFVGHGFIQGIISLGSIFILSNYFSKLQGAIGSSTNILDQLIYYKSAISRMIPIYWEKVTAKHGIKSFPSAWDQITLDHAKFDYHNEERVDSALDDVSLNIQKLSKVSVVGKSGSGKSTLAKIFLGLYELDSGNYLIGPTNFYDLNHEEMTKNIALVLQDSEMFNLSLQDNITLMREFDQNLFNNAMNISQLNDLVKSLPNGLNTMIGEKGYRLSGGERQRIGIARAIYKDPQILVLDEATSSLDSKTESLILQAMETELTKKTLVMIVHRVTTLKNVDKIYVFDHGKIVEEGTYKGLSADPKSKFFELSQLKT